MNNLLINLYRRTRFCSLTSLPLEIQFPSLTSQIFYKDFYINTQLRISEDKTTTKQLQNNKKKANPQVVKITLLGLNKNDSITITSLEEAKKLSHRRDLKLIKVQDYDTKTQRPVYKLATAAEVLLDDTTQSEEVDNATDKNKKIKGEKLLTIGSRITDHDLESRLKNITKWLTKGHEVRILIQCGSETHAGEVIFTKMESATKEYGKLVQKRIKGGNIRFSLLPLAEAKPL